MRLDAHQHFWKYKSADYGWISDEMSVLKRDHLPRELEPLLVANGFDGSIVIQAQQSIEETLWLLDLAERNAFIKGVVGWVDFCSGGVREQLRKVAGKKRLVGVRHVLQAEPVEFMLRPEFCSGIAQLSEFGLAYDLLLYPRHLPNAVKLVREFPEQRFVLDHIAKPRIAERVIEPWKRDITDLAKLPNVWCKLSGMVTEARWNEWTAADFRPYLDVVFEAFGASRLMIGSDWPVCTVSGDYAAVTGIIMEYIAPLTTEEREGILGGNCARAYGIGL